MTTESRSQITKSQDSLLSVLSQNRRRFLTTCGVAMFAGLHGLKSAVIDSINIEYDRRDTY